MVKNWFTRIFGFPVRGRDGATVASCNTGGRCSTSTVSVWGRENGPHAPLSLTTDLLLAKQEPNEET